MTIIDVNQLYKVFRMPQKEEGLAGAVKHLFVPKYKDVVAVAGLDFKIGKGESVAYIGVNGAGKSTTIKILAGILNPTKGGVKVNGLVPYKQRMKHASQIGVVFGHRTHLWWDLPVIESLKLIKAIYNVADDDYQRNIQMYCELMNLHEFLNVPVRRLSLGQRTRADLAAALLHDPPILFLDEPTIGLDIFAKDTLRNFIRFINQTRKTTILLTSHDLKDIEDICDRLIIIDKGAIIYDGSLQKIKRKYASHRELVLNLENVNAEECANVLSLSNISSKVVIKSEKEIRLQFDSNVHSISNIVKELLSLYEIQDFSIHEPNLEDIIKRIFNGERNF